MRVLDVEAPLNAGVPLSSEVPEYTAYNGSSFKGQPSTQQWRPSKKAIFGSVAGLVVVAALVFGLVFGIKPNGSSSDNSVKPLSASCSDIAQGNFWEYLVPDLYEIGIDLQPELFAVELTAPTGIANPVFNGSTAITFNVSQSTSCLVLHANNLTFNEITVSMEGDEGPIAICSSVEECNNVITGVVKEPIRGSDDIDLVAIDLTPAGVVLDASTKPKFSFVYSGVVGIAPNVTGLHRSAPVPYCSSEATQLPKCTAKTMIATQLERNGARRLFPSYDMPFIKSRFITRVTAPIEDAPVVLGNMEEASRIESEDGKYVTVEFEPTPIMSTYLVAIAAGDLKQVQGITAPAGSQYKIRGWAAPGKEQSMAEAVRIGYKAFEHYTAEYTSVTQPVKNYDFVAIPGKPYAMENWGLLLFDETRVLYNASTSGAYGLVRVASVVCHEIAHQWLGNLATCASWTQLMVNEGLASEEEYDCMQYAVPELSADVLRYKVVTPAADARSPHEGPLSIAISIASDSLLPPACPVSDFELNEYGVERLVYSKGASTYFMLRYALDQLMGPLGNFWKPTLNRLLELHQYSTMVYSDIFYAALDTYGAEYNQRVGPGKEIEVMNWAGGLILRTEQMRPSRGDLEKERQFGSDGSSYLGAWAYSPAYPLFDTRKPGLVNPNDYLETLANIGTNQTHYCSYNITSEQGNELNFSEEQMTRIESACEGPAKFANVFVMHNLTDCPANKSLTVSAIAGPIDYGPVAADDWVLNQHAVRLWRTIYSQVHFDNLVEETAQMAACPAAADTTNVTLGSDGYCCAAAGDLLEANGVFTDAVVFAQDGTYNVDDAMRMVEAATRAPVASTGIGQYLLLNTAIEAMEFMRGHVAPNATCAALYGEFETEMLKPYSQAILEAALKPFPFATNSTIGIDGSRELLLARLAVSPLLSYAAYVPPAAQSGGSGDAATSGKRRLLQTDAEATAVPGPAPAPVEEDSTQDAPAPAPADGPESEGTPSPSTAPTPAPKAASPAAAPTPAAAPAPPAAATTATNGDVELQAELCSLLPSTPLWQNFINYGNPSTNTTSVPVDLLPAIYGLAAAMPPGCRSALETIYAATSLAQLAATDAGQQNPYADIGKGIIHALNECYFYNDLSTEATRCAYALPNARDPRVLVSFTPSITSPTFTNVYKFANRRAAMANVLSPWVYANIAKKSSSAYVAVANDLATGGLWDSLGATTACATVNLMSFVAIPVNIAQADALDQLVSGRAQECPPDVVGRMKGKALMARKNAERTQQQMCAYLDGWQARQEQGR